MKAQTPWMEWSLISAPATLKASPPPLRMDGLLSFGRHQWYVCFGSIISGTHSSGMVCTTILWWLYNICYSALSTRSWRHCISPRSLRIGLLRIVLRSKRPIDSGNKTTRAQRIVVRATCSSLANSIRVFFVYCSVWRSIQQQQPWPTIQHEVLLCWLDRRFSGIEQRQQ